MFKYPLTPGRDNKAFKYTRPNFYQSKRSTMNDTGITKSIKRDLESDSDIADDQSRPSSNKRKKLDPIQIQPFKNSIQHIHEIVNIQPVKFDLVSNEGPAHKPVFKFRLKFKLYENIISIFASANSTKQAKKIASLKAINFLVKTPNFFHEQEIEYFGYIIESELKLLNIDQSAIEDVQEIITDTTEQAHKPVSRMIPINLDPKTIEVIATRNSLVILNHLIPKTSYKDYVIAETGLFKVEINVKKELISNGSLESSSTSTESALFKETSEEFIFFGLGNSKKIAKTRAAQLLLEVLFNIKTTNPDLDLALSDDHSGEISNKFREFADNVSELLSNKYKELVEKMSLKKRDAQDETQEENELNQNKFLNVYSGIVQSNGIDFSTAKLVCLSTGTKCISGENMSQIGTSLNDW